MINLDNVFETFDSMREMKRYKAPTKDYFPTEAEINTYARENIEEIIPYFLWLEDSLSPEGMELHKNARAALRRIVQELTKEGKIE